MKKINFMLWKKNIWGRWGYFEMQHGGCSKRKRNLRDAAKAASRIYHPTPEVASAISKRCKQLRKTAKAIAGS